MADLAFTAFEDNAIVTKSDEAEHPVASILRAAIDLQEKLKRTDPPSNCISSAGSAKSSSKSLPHQQRSSGCAPLCQLGKIERQQKGIRLKIWAILQLENR